MNRTDLDFEISTDQIVLTIQIAGSPHPSYTRWCGVTGVWVPLPTQWPGQISFPHTSEVSFPVFFSSFLFICVCMFACMWTCVSTCAHVWGCVILSPPTLLTLRRGLSVKPTGTWQCLVSRACFLWGTPEAGITGGCHSHRSCTWLCELNCHCAANAQPPSHRPSL